MQDATNEYLEMLARRGEEGEDDDDDDDDAASTWSEEVTWVSALDSLDMYEKFASTLRGQSSSFSIFVGDEELTAGFFVCEQGSRAVVRRCSNSRRARSMGYNGSSWSSWRRVRCREGRRRWLRR